MEHGDPDSLPLHVNDLSDVIGPQVANISAFLRAAMRLEPNGESGESEIRYFVKSETGRLAFCGNCGSSLFGKRSDIRMIHLRAGILDDAPSQQPQYHVCTNSKAPWYAITDDLQQYGGLPPSKRS